MLSQLFYESQTLAITEFMYSWSYKHPAWYIQFFTETTNKYVEVTFRSATDVVCTFLNDMTSDSEKSCTITYGQCQQRLFMTANGTTSTDSPNIIYLDLESTLQTYCYIINASNATITVLMEGTHESKT